jgi:hypothetical protein
VNVLNGALILAFMSVSHTLDRPFRSNLLGVAVNQAGERDSPSEATTAMSCALIAGSSSS